jgi:hypothetical protein
MDTRLGGASDGRNENDRPDDGREEASSGAVVSWAYRATIGRRGGSIWLFSTSAIAHPSLSVVAVRCGGQSTSLGTADTRPGHKGLDTRPGHKGPDTRPGHKGL